MTYKKFLLGIFISFLLVCLPTFIPIGSDDSKQEVEIYLISNSIHIGIIVPTKNNVHDWNDFLDKNHFQGSNPLDWLEVGWGDRRFYFEMPTWDHFTVGLAADALFLPDPAVMHVGYIEDPASYGGVTKVKISYETYRKMVTAIKSSFVLKNNKPILIAGKGYSPTDNFYEAHGSYSIIRTCNVWTSEIFAQSGLKHPLWSPTKYGLELIWKK